MIKVIKHGHAQYKLTCEFCECIFTFEDSDIKNNGCQRDWSEFIACPECGRNNEIHSRKQIENHSHD